MTTITAILALSTALFYALYAYHANRAHNLDVRVCDLADQPADTIAALEDAQRNEHYWQQRVDSLLCENNTLLVDLEHTDRRNAYLESLHSHRKGEVAGVRLVASGCEKMKAKVAP